MTTIQNPAPANVHHTYVGYIDLVNLQDAATNSHEQRVLRRLIDRASRSIFGTTPVPSGPAQRFTMNLCQKWNQCKHNNFHTGNCEPYESGMYQSSTVQQYDSAYAKPAQPLVSGIGPVKATLYGHPLIEDTVVFDNEMWLVRNVMRSTPVEHIRINPNTMRQWEASSGNTWFTQGVMPNVRKAIKDCVAKNNGSNVFVYAIQSGTFMRSEVRPNHF